jgi:hypothetical protein
VGHVIFRATCRRGALLSRLQLLFRRSKAGTRQVWSISLRSFHQAMQSLNSSNWKGGFGLVLSGFRERLFVIRNFFGRGRGRFDVRRYLPVDFNFCALTLNRHATIRIKHANNRIRRSRPSLNGQTRVKAPTSAKIAPAISYISDFLTHSFSDGRLQGAWIPSQARSTGFAASHL